MTCKIFYVSVPVLLPISGSKVKDHRLTEPIGIPCLSAYKPIAFHGFACYVVRASGVPGTDNQAFSLYSYAALIADWPVVVLGVCTVLIVVCALVGILVPDLPDFSDPLLVSERHV